MPATAQLQLTEQQQDELDRCASSRSFTARAVERAKIILGLAAGQAKREIAAQLGIVRQTVWRWEQRFRQQGIPGLEDAPRSGRPCAILPQKIEEIVQKTIQETPPDSTHWSTRSLAQQVKVSALTTGEAAWLYLSGDKDASRLRFRASGPDLASARFEAAPGEDVQTEQ